MTYTNSNITIEEYIRLYDVKEPVILDTADLVIAQEDELKAAYSKKRNKRLYEFNTGS